MAETLDGHQRGSGCAVRSAISSKFDLAQPRPARTDDPSSEIGGSSRRLSLGVSTVKTLGDWSFEQEMFAFVTCTFGGHQSDASSSLMFGASEQRRFLSQFIIGLQAPIPEYRVILE